MLDLGGSIIASMRFEDQDPGTADPYANDYFFYNYDIRGSVSNVIKPDGSTVKEYSYDEFGQSTTGGAEVFEP